MARRCATRNGRRCTSRMLEIPGQVWQRVKTGPLWKSLFRHGYPDSRKNQSLALFTNVLLHLHPVKVRGHEIARATPAVGDEVSFLLFGGYQLGPNALLRFYVLHVVALPLATGFLIAIHFWRIRKDGGISGPL